MDFWNQALAKYYFFHLHYFFYFSYCTLQLILIRHAFLFSSIYKNLTSFQVSYAHCKLEKEQKNNRKIKVSIKIPQVLHIMIKNIYPSFLLLLKVKRIFHHVTLLKIENNLSSVIFTHFREKTHLFAFQLIFISSS